MCFDKEAIFIRKIRFKGREKTFRICMLTESEAKLIAEKKEEKLIWNCAWCNPPGSAMRDLLERNKKDGEEITDGCCPAHRMLMILSYEKFLFNKKNVKGKIKKSEGKINGLFFTIKTKVNCFFVKFFMFLAFLFTDKELVFQPEGPVITVLKDNEEGKK